MTQFETDDDPRPVDRAAREPESTGKLQQNPLSLRPDLALFPLDDDVVVFSEEAQCLMGLNASAARVVGEIQAGTPVSLIERQLISEGTISPGEATQWVTTVLDALASHGLLSKGAAPFGQPAGPPDENARLVRLAREMPPYAPVNPVAEQHYRLLDTCALIRFGHLAQMRMVNTVIGHLATDDSCVPTVTMEIQAKILENKHLRSNVYRDGTPVGYAPRLSVLGPVVKAALWQSAVNAHDFLFYIHAGVVGMDESCMLLPAAAGSGKSSLTAALSHGGFRYFSDEVALIERTTFKVPPVPLAICVKSTGWDLMARFYPDILTLPMHHRDDGKDVRYIPPPAGAAQQPPAPVSHIIFPRHEKDAPTELKPITRSEALGRLMGECQALRRRLDQKNVGQLVRWIAGIDCYALTFSSLEDAVGRIAQVTASENL